jgi:hypothetical protein
VRHLPIAEVSHIVHQYERPERQHIAQIRFRADLTEDGVEIVEVVSA